MKIRAEMAKARRVAVQRGRIPQEFVLNPTAWTRLAKEQDEVSGEWGAQVFMGIPIIVAANRQRTPTVALRCKGVLHPVPA